jgi:hypothetical protein
MSSPVFFLADKVLKAVFQFGGIGQYGYKVF